MTKFLLFFALTAFSGLSARAQTVLPTTPFAMSQSVKNGPLYFEIPVVPGRYFYLTDISITGNGGILPPTSPPPWVLIKYVRMSPKAEHEADPVSVDLINPPSPSQQVDFHRAFSDPWKSADSGGSVEITIDAFGAGNIGIAARIIGFFR